VNVAKLPASGAAPGAWADASDVTSPSQSGAGVLHHAFQVLRNAVDSTIVQNIQSQMSLVTVENAQSHASALESAVRSLASKTSLLEMQSLETTRLVQKVEHLETRVEQLSSRLQDLALRQSQFLPANALAPAFHTCWQDRAPDLAFEITEKLSKYVNDSTASVLSEACNKADAALSSSELLINEKVAKVSTALDERLEAVRHLGGVKSEVDDKIAVMSVNIDAKIEEVHHLVSSKVRELNELLAKCELQACSATQVAADNHSALRKDFEDLFTSCEGNNEDIWFRFEKIELLIEQIAGSVGLPLKRTDYPFVAQMKQDRNFDANSKVAASAAATPVGEAPRLIPIVFVPNKEEKIKELEKQNTPSGLKKGFFVKANSGMNTSTSINHVI